MKKLTLSSIVYTNKHQTNMGIKTSIKKKYSKLIIINLFILTSFLNHNIYSISEILIPKKSKSTINANKNYLINPPSILSPHMKNYFILGTDSNRYGNQAKFQVSVKLKLIPQTFYNSNLYFSWSQRTFLDYLITSNKKYTYDSVIMPEIFIRKYLIKHPFIKYVGIGIKHGSNGRGESWGDRIMLHSKMYFLTHFSLLTEIWGKSLTMNPNKPTDDYFGNGKLILTGYHKYFNLSAKTYFGITKKIPLSAEITLDFPLHQSLCLSLQYWNGYAETFYTDRDVSPYIEHFRKRTKRFRIGMAIPLNLNEN